MGIAAFVADLHGFPIVRHTEAEVGSVANLFETGYGQTLLVKIALVGLLIVVAAYNRLLLVPWLSAAEARRRRAASV